MVPIDTTTLGKIATGVHEPKLSQYTDLLNKAMDEFDISTPERQAAFIAQVLHESGEFFYLVELASGTAYEGREDLGNTQPGDGVKYKGRGLIQITCRSNYKAVGDALGVDFVNNPTLLQQPDYATRSAAWFWQHHGLNLIADEDSDDSFLRITKIINGGTNGLADRMKFWYAAKQVMGV